MSTHRTDKARGSSPTRNEESWRPVILAEPLEAWSWVIKEAGVEDEFPEELTISEKLIFGLGMIAGRARERGFWEVSEAYKPPAREGENGHDRERKARHLSVIRPR